LPILPEYQKPFYKKGIFYLLEWLKICFDAFEHIFSPPETCPLKRYFLTSGGVKNVF
jgi:hypothetical protein